MSTPPDRAVPPASVHGAGSTGGPPPAEGVRLHWKRLPERVRGAVERRLGGAVVSATTQPSGFSPGLAARLVTAGGRRAFVKAAGPEPNPFAAAIHRREAVIVRALPPAAPVPRLLWTHDEGEHGWVVLAFEDVEGRHPAQPWRLDELERVVQAIDALHAALTPAPATASPAAERFQTEICGWRRLGEERGTGTWTAALDPWSARYLGALVELEATAPSAVDGDTLLHLDLRADNVLLTDVTEEGNRASGHSRHPVYVVDWPHACVGAPFVDLVCMAPSVTMQGGPPPEAVVALSASYERTAPAALTAVVASLAGFFTHRALQPPPPGLPTVRAFQAAQGAVARAWLAARTGLE